MHLKLKACLEQQALPLTDSPGSPSEKTFADGAQYRIEIPSVEGPKVLAAVLQEARTRKLNIQRVSQGSGIMLLTDKEISEMAQMGAEHQIEVSLFVGPRAAWDTGAQISSSAGKNLAARLRGMKQLIYATEDVFRAVDLGIRSILVADEGQLWLIQELKQRGDLPANLVCKISVQMGAANPISIKLLEHLGAGTYNVPTDLSLEQLASIRAATHIPLDIYVEVPDDFGGFVRYYDIPSLIRYAAPVYVKLGLRNAPNIYPSGLHIENTAIQLARERVRRAEIALDIIKRYCPEVSTTIDHSKATDLGIPEV